MSALHTLMIPQQSYCVSVDQNSKFHLEQIIRLWYRLKSLEKKKNLEKYWSQWSTALHINTLPISAESSFSLTPAVSWFFSRQIKVWLWTVLYRFSFSGVTHKYFCLLSKKRKEEKKNRKEKCLEIDRGCWFILW